MKVKELKGLIREAVKKTLLEAGYDQYGEGFYSMEEDDTALMEALYEKHVGFKNLVKKLQGQGKSVESAKKIAYSIGKKKYGKKKMTQAAASGKQLSDKEALDEITQSLMGVSVGATEEDLARKIAQYIADGANGMKAVVTALSRNSDFDKLIPTLNIEGIRQMMLSYDDLRPSPREVEEAVGILQSFKEEGLDETALAEAPPEGWHGTVRAMKTHGHTGKGGIDNPYALAHYMANKGDEPHYKEQPSSKRGTPEKKKGQ